MTDIEEEEVPESEIMEEQIFGEWSLVSIYLYNKTRIRINVHYSWPKGWTEWADIFQRNPGVTYAKQIFFLKNLVFSFFISCFFKSTENAGHFTGADTGFKPGGARFFRYKIV